MASEYNKARPISVVSKKDTGVFSPAYRPTLDDVLNGRAPAPYTLAAYTAFLSQQHCLETLEFVTEAKKYATKYDEAAAMYCGMPLTSESEEGFELMQDWIRMMDVYVKPGAPREINLPAEERDDLVDEQYDPKPPKPEALDPAVQRMRDLMSDSIFIPFCNSVKMVSHASTYNALTEFSHRSDISDSSALTYDERGNAHRRQQSKQRRSPPTSSAFQPSRSPPQASNRSSALTSALSQNSPTRLSHHLSNTSGTSESALTDDSGGGESPSVGDLDSTMPSPITPPTSDLHPGHGASHAHAAYPPSAKPSRSESGGWRKMGMKIFGAKKKNSSQDEQ